MAIKWVNIRSGEEQIAESEPHISAMWASSDHSPNITQGQDFGWRLAPVIVVELKEIKQDPVVLQQIALKYKKSIEDVNEPDILTWISDKYDRENAPAAMEGDYTDMYDQEVRRATQESLDRKKALLTPAVGATETQESLADLERRVELEERLAAARAVTAAADNTIATATTTEDTTTTTTEAPSTTTTTTAATKTTSSNSKK